MLNSFCLQGIVSSLIILQLGVHFSESDGTVQDTTRARDNIWDAPYSPTDQLGKFRLEVAAAVNERSDV